LANECRVDDLNRVGVHHDWELRNWSREFGVSADELRAAINAVGDRVGALRQYLDQRSLAICNGVRASSVDDDIRFR